jgi:ferric-dicitrate binding protein FerR (iron transport regulator)
VREKDYSGAIRRLVRPRLEAPPDLPADERRLVAAVEQALRARARRRVLVRRAGAVTFAAAAGLALVAGLRARPDHRASDAAPTIAAGQGDHALKVLAEGDATPGSALADARTVPLERGMPVGVGLTLRAPASGEVRVGTADGTSLALEAGGQLTVTEAGATRRFALARGAVIARVSRLFASERFIVDTRDAEVEVHGTAFRVAVVPGEAGCGGGSTTRVSVLEGVVRVRAGGVETSVPAGGAWPVGCDERPARSARASEHPRARPAHRAELADGPARPVELASAPAHPAEAPVAEPAVPRAATPAEAAPAPPPRPASSLGAENDLFAAAVRAKKDGRSAEAARLFGELATSHPGSPLVESALVQRMKILATTDTAAAARAAAAYLERYPAGFARPDARELVDRAAP